MPLGISAISPFFMYNFKCVHLVFLPGASLGSSIALMTRGQLDCICVTKGFRKDSSSRLGGGCVAICNLASEVISATFSCLKHYEASSAGKELYIDFTSWWDNGDRSLVRKTWDRRYFSLLTIVG